MSYYARMLARNITVLVVVIVGSNAFAQSYEVIEVKDANLPNTKGIVGRALNNRGTVVGDIASGSSPKGFVYKSGHLTLLGPLRPGAQESSSLVAVNDLDQAVGFAMGDDALTRAVLYSNDKLRQLTEDSSRAVSINNHGAITGTHARAGVDGLTAFAITDGTPVDKPSFVTLFINDQGNEAGVDRSLGAVLKIRGVIKRIGPCDVTAISENNAVIGACGTTIPGKPAHAYLYDEHGMHDLSVLPGATSNGNSSSFGINSKGDVVGRSEYAAALPGQFHAFLYSGGRIVDLNSLVSGPKLYAGMAINDSGQILASGQNIKGAFGTFLLTPKR